MQDWVFRLGFGRILLTIFANAKLKLEIQIQNLSDQNLFIFRPTSGRLIIELSRESPCEYVKDHQILVRYFLNQDFLFEFR